MRSVDVFSEMVKRHGLPLTMSAKNNPLNNRQFSAFIQPLRYKNKMYLDGTYSEVGYIDQAYYLYIGPPDINILSLPEDATVEFMGKKYNFTRSEKVAIGQQVLYYWSVLRSKIEEA